MKKLVTFVVSAFFLLVFVTLWQISCSSTFQFFGQLISRVNASQKVVALTFDDGPTPDATSQIISILGEEHVRATFFVTGAEMEKNMAAGQQLVAAGHELGNHSYSHERMVLLTPSFVKQEIERTDKLTRVLS